MKYIIVVCLMLAAVLASAQSKKVIAEKGIKIVYTYEQDIDEGENEMKIEKEEHFNAAGELVELKEFDERGRIDKWEQYVFSEEGKMIVEKTLNFRGDVEKRIEYIYEGDLCVRKNYYDAKNRLYKIKKYEFSY